MKEREVNGFFWIPSESSSWNRLLYKLNFPERLRGCAVTEMIAPCVFPCLEMQPTKLSLGKPDFITAQAHTRGLFPTNSQPGLFLGQHSSTSLLCLKQKLDWKPFRKRTKPVRFSANPFDLCSSPNHAILPCGVVHIQLLSHAQKPFPPSVSVFKVVLRPSTDAEWAVETGPPPLLESTPEL